ncbi:MAG TPA: hydrolase TatD, partial [Firmicutes bacterium]|nr:hydrolase TatD [Bacillota bacterium]
MKLFDTHCHLNDEAFRDDVPAVLTRAREAGVENLLVVGYDLASSQQALKLAEDFPGIFAAVGFHP